LYATYGIFLAAIVQYLRVSCFICNIHNTHNIGPHHNINYITILHHAICLHCASTN